MIHTLILAATATTLTPSDGLCVALGNFGQAVIIAREANAPIEVILERVSKEDEPLRSLLRNMVLITYSKPPQGLPPNRTELKNRIIADCITEMERARLHDQP